MDDLIHRAREALVDVTPGPWHHDADDQRRIDYTDPRSGTCWNVAYVHSHCGHPIDGSSSNARRIAALPDLEAAYLSLYYEVKRLRAERDDWMSARNDAVRERMTAEAERDRLRDALANIAVMGFDNNPAVSDAIARSAVKQARAALKGVSHA